MIANRGLFSDAPHILAAVATLVAIGLSPPASAGIVINNALEARAEVVADGLGNPPVIDTSNNPAFASDLLTNGGVTSQATAEATYGLLKASAQISKGAAIEPFNFATGTARFTDTLTVSGGVGTAQIGFTFQLDGLLEDINAGEQRARVELNVFLPGSFQGHNEVFFVESGTSRALDELIATPGFDFDFDTPFAVEVSLTAYVELEETDNGVAASNFANSSRVVGVTVSSGGAPLGGVTLSSSSGMQYPIPEPGGAALLLLLGLAGLGRGRCR